MRWQQLFDDIEAQWDAEDRRDRDAEVADRTRRARAEVGLAHRLGAHLGHQLTVTVVTGQWQRGRLHDIGDGWLLLGDVGGGGECLVPIHAIAAVSGLSAAVADSRAARRFGLGYALRGLSRDRAVVTLADTSGARVTGTIDLVGADTIDLAEHSPDQARRRENVRGIRTVPFGAIVSVRA